MPTIFIRVWGTSHSSSTVWVPLGQLEQETGVNGDSYGDDHVDGDGESHDGDDNDGDEDDDTKDGDG